MDFSDLIGFAGTLLVIVAYAPQLHHLWKEKCSEGVSFFAWELWLLGSILLLLHALSIGDAVFSLLQAINILAIAAILILARRNAGRVCPSCQLRVQTASLKRRKQYRNCGILI